MGLLANVGSFPMGDIDLTRYIRRLTLYGEILQNRMLEGPQATYTRQIHPITRWASPAGCVPAAARRGNPTAGPAGGIFQVGLWLLRPWLHGGTARKTQTSGGTIAHDL